MKLEIQFFKSGISLTTPFPPQRKYQSLPPILRKKNQKSISGYSKAS